MKTILFIDALNSKAYCHTTPAEEALGGTEATVMRVAEGLGKTYRVYVAQSHRAVMTHHGNVSYLSLDDIKTGDFSPDVCVMVRKYQRLGEFARYHPKATWYLWMHTIPKKV